MEYVTLGSIVSIKGGKRLPAGVSLSKKENDHPYIRVRDLNNVRMLEKTEDFEYVDDETQKSIARYIVDKGDIVISIVGTIGLIAIVGDSLHHANLTENCVRLTDISKDYDSLFLYYYLVSGICQDEIKKSTVGAVQPKLPLKNIAMIPVPKIDLQTQKRIAGILSSLDDKIEVNNQINRNLEEQAKAIFKSWFVDFEPFGGEPPDDWKTISFSSFLRPRREKSSAPSIPLFAVTNTGIIPRDSKFKKNLSRTGTQNKVAYKTDMLFGMSREILNWGIMREEIGCISSAYHVFAVSEDIDSLYLELYIQANIDHFRDLIRPAAREGQGLDQQALMTKTLLLPPKDIISAYHDIADPVSKQNQNLKTENAALSTLRDTLLPKLMSGEITLP